MIKLNDYVIKADIFPDKTSQVWFIPKEELAKPWNIQWVFESESELMHLLQLKALLTSEDSRKQITLAMPFLPYGRQDKDVSNEQSFAFKVFKDTLMLHGFHRVFTIDAHNPEVLPMGWSNIMPREQIQKAIQEVKPHFICYPDTGASRRGYMHPFIPSFNMKKIRDQKTGDIKGIETELPLCFDSNHRILILDDICDGGRTFIEAAKYLKTVGATDINLYVTHGIFSKGTEVLFEAGINRVFTYKGEVSND